MWLLFLFWSWDRCRDLRFFLVKVLIMRLIYCGMRSNRFVSKACRVHYAAFVLLTRQWQVELHDEHKLIKKKKIDVVFQNFYRLWLLIHLPMFSCHALMAEHGGCCTWCHWHDLCSVVGCAKVLRLISRRTSNVVLYNLIQESCPVWSYEHSCSDKHVFNWSTSCRVAGTASDFNATLCSHYRATDCSHSTRL